MSMAEDFLPQCAARAVIDIEADIKFAERAGAGDQIIVRAYREIVKLIRSAVHIVLPENGEVYRSNLRAAPPTSDEVDSMLGIPAPICCFEYPWTYQEGNPKETQAATTKRITLVVDHRQTNRGPAPNGGSWAIQFFSICFFPSINRWSVSTGYMLSLWTPIEILTGDGMWGAKCAFTDIQTGEDSLTISTEKFGEFLPDISAVAQCCHALRAGASFEERRETSSARRWRMDKHGVGGFTYHILKLPGGRVHSGAPTGVTHESPRFHVRRAHIRKLPTGRLTFVRHCFVGDSQRGSVSKHYLVDRPKEQ